MCIIKLSDKATASSFVTVAIFFCNCFVSNCVEVSNQHEQSKYEYANLIEI